MELHPILEQGNPPARNLWYVLSAFGDSPSMRVGHTCTYIPSCDPDGGSGKLYVIGGANPDGAFAETCVLDLDTFTWDVCDATGLKARYEHSAFVAQSDPTKIYVFGGAHQGSNHNDVQQFDTVTQTWSTVAVNGAAPSPRTYHTAACVGDQFIVYSGGQCGSEPVGDRQVYSFDATTHTWSTLNVRGDSPKPRHGHLVVAVGNKIFVHGGMSGTTFYNDLYILDLNSKTWSSVKQKKGCPSARAAHNGVVFDSHLYVFAGMNRDGALDDAFKLNIETLKWTKVQLEGPPPACRLDFGMCTVRLHVTVAPPGDSDSDMMVTGKQAKEYIEQQLGRFSSAGSTRSLASSYGSSAGSVTHDDCILDLPSSPSHNAPADGQLPQSPDGAALTCDGDCPVATVMPDTLPPLPHVAVEMCLVMGGMDTEGEMFDDTLVMLLEDPGNGVGVNGAGKGEATEG